MLSGNKLSRLRLIGRMLLLSPLLCVSWSVSSSEAASQPTTTATTSPTTQPNLVAVLGTTVGKPVDSGLVFYKGRYIEAPYIVTRAGLEVCINNIPIRKWTTWPLPKNTTEDPGLPVGLTNHSTLSDIREEEGPNKGHEHREYRYLYHVFSAEIADRKMAEYYKALPFVADVVVEPRSFRLKLNDGSVSRVSRDPPHPGFNLLDDMTEEKLVKLLNEGREYYEKALKSGNCFLFFGGAELSFGRQKAAHDLKAVIEVLRSSRSQDEKRDLLQRLGVLPPGKQFDCLITDFQASDQLDKTIQSLADTTGIKPRLVSEIPKLSEWERIQQARLQEDAARKKAAVTSMPTTQK